MLSVCINGESENFMRGLSNKARKRMIDKALFCKRQGNLQTALDVINKAIAIESKQLGLCLKKLKSQSYVTVPSRARVTRSDKLPTFNKGDYYYSDLNCVFLHGERAKKAS